MRGVVYVGPNTPVMFSWSEPFDPTNWDVPTTAGEFKHMTIDPPDEIVGRVATAIEEQCAGSDPRDGKAFLAAARSAIVALRVPTPAMVRAGEAAVMGDASATTLREAWAAMIDGALRCPVVHLTEQEGTPHERAHCER